MTPPVGKLQGVTAELEVERRWLGLPDASGPLLHQAYRSTRLLRRYGYQDGKAALLFSVFGAIVSAAPITSATVTLTGAGYPANIVTLDNRDLSKTYHPRSSTQ